MKHKGAGDLFHLSHILDLCGGDLANPHFSTPMPAGFSDSFHFFAQVDGHRQGDDKRGSAHQMSGGCDSRDVCLIATAADHTLMMVYVLLQAFPLPCIYSVTSPTTCLAWSVSPSASSLSSQGTTSITSCWGSTAGDASGRWGSADGRT